MVFDGLKNFFNRIGGITVDSSKKVGEGVSVPVDKLGENTIQNWYKNIQKSKNWAEIKNVLQ